MWDGRPDIPKSIGPYQVLEPLGRGGMGVVYRCRHTRSGAEAAVKTVRVPNPKRILGIRREIRALARIPHPGIVRIVEEGVAGNLPWYAMELLEGVTFRRYWAEFVWGTSAPLRTAVHGDPVPDYPAGTATESDTPSLWWTQLLGSTLSTEELRNLYPKGSPAALDPPVAPHGRRIAWNPSRILPALTMLYKICRTLAFLHGRSIVHGDLKPENIFIRRGELPVLIDFGLTSRTWSDISREELDTHTLLGGTAVYISPEQITGDLLDPRSDLYSLGCILYELTTGHVPFPGRTYRDTIQAHLTRLPAPPDTLVNGLPAPLNNLILQLLEKRPQDRPAYAADVADVLAGLGVDVRGCDEYPKPRLYVYRPRFYGRETAMQACDAMLRSLPDPQGHMVMIHGDTGIGKTRFLLELARRAHWRNIRVLASECAQNHDDPDTGTSPNPALAPLKRPLQLIAEACMNDDPGEVRRVFADAAICLTPVLPGIRTLLQLNGDPEPAELSPNAARLRLFSAILDVLLRFAQKHPLLLLLDNLQWADDTTLAFLEFVLRVGRLNRGSLMITGAFRSGDITKTLDRIRTSRNCHCTELSRLDRDSAQRMIRDILPAGDIPRTIMDFLVDMYSGNPFFIAEYLRSAVAAGTVHRTPMGNWDILDRELPKNGSGILPVPSAIRELMENHFLRLSPRAEEVVACASVIGYDVDTLLLCHSIPYTDEYLDAIDELVRRQLIKEVSSGALQFAHPSLQRIAYQGLTPDHRRQLHAAVAEALEKLYGSDNPEHFSVLARHHHRAGHTDQARKFYLALARHAAASYSLQTAETAYTAYLDLAPDPTPESLAVRIEFIRSVLVVQGRYGESRDQYAAALDAARRLNLPRLESRSLQGLADAYRVMGDLDRSEAFCRKALTICEQLTDEMGTARAYNCLGSVRLNQGRLPDALEFYRTALAIQESGPAGKFTANTLVNMAEVFQAQHDYRTADDCYQKALDIYAALENPLSLGWCYGNAASNTFHLGDVTGARDMLEKAIAIMETVGDRHAEGIYTGNLANIHMALKDLPTARKLYENALRILREIPDRKMEGVILINLADLFRASGQHDKALEMLTDAVALFSAAGNHLLQVQALTAMAELHRVHRRDLHTAGKIVSEADTIARRIGFMEGIARCLLERCRLAAMEHRPPGRALEELNTMMSTHADTLSAELIADVADLNREMAERNAADPPRS